VNALVMMMIMRERTVMRRIDLKSVPWITLQCVLIGRAVRDVVVILLREMLVVLVQMIE